MAYAITQPCCADASCVAVCPVNCIHPAPGEPDFGSTDLLYIDPRTCIDCGACTDACPVQAIVPAERLIGADTEYAERSAAYYHGRTAEPAWPEPAIPASLPWPGRAGGTGRAGDTGAVGGVGGAEGSTELGRAAETGGPAETGRTEGRGKARRRRGGGPRSPRIAIVGTGPAACYTAEALLHSTGARITLFERLPVPGGLLRFGVAPDHPATRRMADSFAPLLRHPRIELRLGTEVGRDIGHQELTDRYDAVVYAVGAASSRALDAPGADRLLGSLPAARLVAWYNGHPDVPGNAVDLSGVRRAVVVGTGNVALDAARMLATDPKRLADTEIAAHALAALRSSALREVVLLGRRDPEQAAWTWPELHAMRHHPDFDLLLDEDGSADIGTPPGASGRRRIVVRFSTAVEAAEPRSAEPGRLGAVRTTAGTVPAELLVAAIGQRGTAVPGLPFDPKAGTVPNHRGRVAGLPGTYVAGWIKRGPSGGIGANRRCAQETANALIEDLAAATAPAPALTLA